MNEVFVKGECPVCGGHLEITTAAAGRPFTCPHCGQPIELLASHEFGKSSRRRLWLVLALVLMVGVILVGTAAIFIIHRLPFHCATAQAAPPPPHTNAAVTEEAPPVMPKPPVDEPRPGEIRTNSFGISGGKLEKMPGSSITYVTGHVRNLDNHQRFGVKVSFTLLNDAGQPIGHATDYQSVIDPHGDWGFKAMVMESKAASAEFSGITEEK